MDEHGIPSEADLKLWLTAAAEYQFVERKSKTDTRGWVRSVVAFANSNPIGSVGVLYIGVKDDGTIPGLGQKELEDTMKSLGSTIAEYTWPPVFVMPITVTVEGKSCIAAVVPYSDQRPHFAGKAYVRRGTETVDATAAQYDELIATRNSKAREILNWKSKEVTVRTMHGPPIGPQISTRPTFVEACGPLFVTTRLQGAMGEATPLMSYSLHAIELSFDNAKSRLMLLIYPDR